MRARKPRAAALPRAAAVVRIAPRIEAARASAFESVLEALKGAAAVDFSAYKPEPMRRAIERRMALAGATDVRAYARTLSTHPAEARTLAGHLLNGTTRFFRDTEAFASLARNVFEPLTCGPSRRNALRAWVPGCSTGEEVYSIAIAYCEFCAETGCTVPLHVVGTDADEARIESARRGIYRTREMEGVCATRRRRFFRKAGGGWRVADALRAGCTFLHHDVLASPPLSGADLVSFRNVLIYLRHGPRVDVLRTLHGALRRGGVLWIGAAESADGAEDLFVMRSAGARAYVKAPGPGEQAPTHVLDGATAAVSPESPAWVVQEQRAAVAEFRAASAALDDALRELDAVGRALRRAERDAHALDARLRILERGAGGITSPPPSRGDGGR